MDEITIPKPDDWHLHLRDGAMLEGVLPFTARHFARAIIMPNLVPPVRNAAEADDRLCRLDGQVSEEVTSKHPGASVLLRVETALKASPKRLK